MKVHGGVDWLRGKRTYLAEAIPPGPTAGGDDEKACTRLPAQVDECCNPRTKSTVNDLRT